MPRLHSSLLCSVISFLILSNPPDGTLLANQAFHCSWKKVQSRGVYTFLSIDLDQSGNGNFILQRVGSDRINVLLHVNESRMSWLRNLFVQANFLDDTKNFSSPRKVADLGMKTLGFTNGSKSREVSFNYTEDKTLQEINKFFENLAQQETVLIEIELALKYDKLGIPEKLDVLEREFNANRIVAPERFQPILKKISDDVSLMHLARKQAGKLLIKISAMQSGPD